MQNLSAIFKFDCAFLNGSELGNCNSCAAVAGEEKKWRRECRQGRRRSERSSRRSKCRRGRVR